MNLSNAVTAISCATLTAGLALASTFLLAHELQRDATLHSHQQPTPERWIEPNTPTTPELVADGRALFLDSCSHCHGADARGDEGPDLHELQVSDRYIATIITRGIPHEMPSFKKKLHEAEITKLTAYLWSLK